jgi:hypothetical protein
MMALVDLTHGLYVVHVGRDHDDHGQCFLEHMYRINKAAGTNISVYHSFHNEVLSLSVCPSC